MPVQPAQTMEPTVKDVWHVAMVGFAPTTEQELTHDR